MSSPSGNALPRSSTPPSARLFHARVASAEDNSGSIEIRIGAPDGKSAGACRIKTTGGTQRWKDVSCEVEGISGVQDLYLRFTGEKNKTLFNLDHWRFE